MEKINTFNISPLGTILLNVTAFKIDTSIIFLMIYDKLNRQGSGIVSYFFK